MKLDTNIIPFSRNGSYLVMNFDKQNKVLKLRDIHGGDESPSEFFEIKLLDEDGVEKEWTENIIFDVTETSFTIIDENGGKAEFILPEKDSMHIRIRDLSLRLIADKVRYDTMNKQEKNKYEYISYKKESKYLFNFIQGKYQVDAPWLTVGNDYVHVDLIEDAELYILQYRVVPEKYTINSFDSSKEKLEKEYQEWLDKMPTVPERYESSREMASYILWTNTVRSEGLLNCDVTFMSKNWMQNIWSWDNCFSSIALAESQPQLAYNQYKIFVDYQDESGAYPDFINDKYVSYNCVKPPIFAWGYKRMIERNPVFSEDKYFLPMYESFGKNINFWLKDRKHPNTGMIYYTHGNDSGWDNSSIFREGMPVSAPDLVAHVVRQLDVLAEFATKLGKTKDAQKYKEQADFYYKQLMTKYFNGKQFVAFNAITGEQIPHTTSALLYIPLVVSYRMDSDMLTQLVNDLIERFESPHGIMTEEPTSEFFKEDGYWLGPIWAPETFMFIDAFGVAGHEDIAKRLAEKFAELTLIGGMAENYNPYTGFGNDDLAFAWPSAVFLSITNYL